MRRWLWRSAAKTEPVDEALPDAQWFLDPTGRHGLRYWDGRQWTDQVADHGYRSVDLEGLVLPVPIEQSEGRDRPSVDTDPDRDPEPGASSVTGAHGRTRWGAALVDRSSQARKRAGAVAVVLVLAAGFGVCRAFDGDSVSREADARRDVEVTGCIDSDFLPAVTVQIKNQSSKRSDYVVRIDIRDASGRKIGEGTAASSGVEPGGSATPTVLATSKGVLAECVITEVDRSTS